MAKTSKRMTSIKKEISSEKQYKIDEAIELLKKASKVKFKETVEVAINLGVDPRKSEQAVRGATVLPNGIGKSVRVAVFAQGAEAETARTAGADTVGFEDLAEAIKGGKLDFEVLIATPEAMKFVGQLGQILGPRGLMPNPKVGTVTKDVATAIKNAKAGQVRYRTDKNGIIHSPIGKIDFDSGALKENLLALLHDLRKHKPSSSKGVYIKKISITSTMGPGLTVDQTSL